MSFREPLLQIGRYSTEMYQRATLSDVSKSSGKYVWLVLWNAYLTYCLEAILC
jgi:hypothetical protein